MDNPQEYLDAILREVEQIKARGGSCLFKVSERVSDNVISFLHQYFDPKTEYSFDTKKCASKRRTWDIILVFKG